MYIGKFIKIYFYKNVNVWTIYKIYIISNYIKYTIILKINRSLNLSYLDGNI